MTNIKRLALKAIKGALTAGIIAAAMPAGATTIYFAGGEDIDFNLIGNAASGIASLLTSYSRSSASVTAGSNASDPPSDARAQTPTFTSISSLWMHAEFQSQGTSSTAGDQIVLFRSPDGVSRLLLRQTGTYGTWKASTRNAAATITDLATGSNASMASGTNHSLDINIVYGCTSGDKFTVYVDGVSVIAYTGASICTDAATQINQIEIMGVNNSAQNTTSGCANRGTTCWAEVIVSDSDTRGMHLWSLAPVAAGNTQSWTPNTVGNVNPTTINDANIVTTSSSSALSEWTTPTSVPSGTWNLLAVVQSARLIRGTTGPQTAEWLLRTIDGTDHVTGTISPTTSFGNFSNQIWATNPHTSAAWTITDIASGFNLGIESQP